MSDIFSAFGKQAHEVEENPFAIPFDTYEAAISKSEWVDGTKNNPGVPFWIIEFTVIRSDNSGAQHAGKSVSQYLRLAPYAQHFAKDGSDDTEAMNARTISSYKKALVDLGMNEAQMAQFNPKQHAAKLQGIRVIATMGPQKNNPGFNQVFSYERKETPAVAPAEESATTVVADSANPAQETLSTSGADLDW